MQSIIVMVVALLGLGLSFHTLYPPTLGGSIAFAEPKMAPDFTLYDLNNEAFTLSQFRGKPIIIHFWASWCPPCIEQLPHIEKRYQEIKNEDIKLITINIDSPRDKYRAVQIMEKRKYTFPFLWDKKSKVISLYQPFQSVPYNVIINREGQIIDTQSGYFSGDEYWLKKKLEELKTKR